MLGQEELAAGQVRLKDLRVDDKKAVDKDRGRLVRKEDLVGEVTKLLSATMLE